MYVWATLRYDSLYQPGKVRIHTRFGVSDVVARWRLQRSSQMGFNTCSVTKDAFETNPTRRRDCVVVHVRTDVRCEPMQQTKLERLFNIRNMPVPLGYIVQPCHPSTKG